MSARERGILVGLAVLLVGGIGYFIYRQGQPAGGGLPPGSAPEGWDLSRLPEVGEPLREHKTDGGVIVQVLSEGRGEAVGKAEAMDVQYQAYAAVSGAMVDRGTKPGLVLSRGGVIEGWTQGLEGIRLRERRRLLVPSAMAYRDQRVRNIPPNTDLVFDVEWVRLEIDELKAGSGKEARLGSKVLVHYRGMLESGTTFDSSYTSSTGKPVEFTLKRGGLIQGWILGIPGMKVGGTRKLWIPWHLAYDARGSPPKVPPYNNLVFVVELLDVQ